MLPDIDPALNSFSIAPGTNPDQEISIAISATDVGTLFVLLSKTQTSPPTVDQMIASGVAIPGSTINYTFVGLDRGATYYGWAVAVQQGYASDVMASSPASLATDPYTFFNSGLLTFTRASVATRVNSAGLIETVPADTVRLDHDPVTLAQKGLIIEESRTNTLMQSSNQSDASWIKTGVGIATSTNFPIFAAGLSSYLMTGNGAPGAKSITQFPPSSSNLITEHITQISSTTFPLKTFTITSVMVFEFDTIASGGFNYEMAVYTDINNRIGVQAATNVNNTTDFKGGPSNTSVSFSSMSPHVFTTRHSYKLTVNIPNQTVKHEFFNTSGTLLYSFTHVFSRPAWTVGATANVLFGVFLNSATLYSVKVYNVPILPTRTLSVFLRKGTNDFAQIIGGSESNEFVNYNLATGVVGSAGSLVTSASMQPWKDGWYRCTFTTASSTTNSFGICIVASNSAARFESNSLATSIYVAGPQSEVGTFATSYIPSGASATTRAGDFASIEGNNFNSWYNPAEGTFGAQFQTIFATDSVPRYILTGNSNQLMYLAANTGTITSFDGQVPALSGSVSAFGVLAKAYLGYSASGRSLSARGADATSSSTAQNFSGMTTLRIGRLDTVPFCGWIRSIVYYPTRLTDAQLKALSA